MRPSFTEESLIDHRIDDNGYYIVYAWDGDNRGPIHLCREDILSIMRGGRWSGTVYDHKSERLLKIRSAPCGFPGCMCEISIVKEII